MNPCGVKNEKKKKFNFVFLLHNHGFFSGLQVIFFLEILPLDQKRSEL
jgi:hypothetical protein